MTENYKRKLWNGIKIYIYLYDTVKLNDNLKTIFYIKFISVIFISK